MNIIVSITSTHYRIKYLSGVIKSLLNNTAKPYKIIIYLSQTSFLIDEGIINIPEDLQKLIDENEIVELKYVENIGPHRKYYYAMLEYKNNLILTLDDDHICPKNLIELFAKACEKYPHCIISGSGKNIKNQNYKTWVHLNKEGGLFNNTYLGGGLMGSLYNPNMFDDAFFNLKEIMEYAPTSSEMWINCYLLKKNIPIFYLNQNDFYPKPIFPLSLPFNFDNTLTKIHIDDNKKHKILKKLIRFNKIENKLNLLFSKPETVLILYSYCETQTCQDSNLLSKENLLFFLHHGMVNDERFQFIINISGDHTIDVDFYQKKFINLKFLNNKVLNSYHSWMKIIETTGNTFDKYIFMKDNIRGPYNLNYIDENYIITNWIDYLLINSEEESCVVMGLGTSPFGKLSKFPYIPDKFFMISNKCLNLMLKNNLFTKIINHSSKVSNLNCKNFNTFPEIILSKFLLENNINYYSVDIRKKYNYQILKLYKNQLHLKLLKLTAYLHIHNDMNISDRIFWSGQIMKEIFENKNQQIIKKINKKRTINNLTYW